MKESSHPNIPAENCKCPICQTRYSEEDLDSGYTEPQMGMSNIDPSIGLQPMSNMGPMGNLNNMSTPRRGIGIRGGQTREEESCHVSSFQRPFVPFLKHQSEWMAAWTAGSNANDSTASTTATSTDG